MRADVLFLWPTSLPSEQDQLVNDRHSALTQGRDVLAERSLELLFVACVVTKRHLLSSQL